MWLALDFVSSQLRSQHCGAEVLEQAPLGNDVANIREIVERNRFGAEQRRSHARQRGILGATYRNAATKRPAASNAKFVHDGNRLE